jgi:hypothetical protein
MRYDDKDISIQRRLRDAILDAIVEEGKTMIYRPSAGMENEEPHHFWGRFGPILDEYGLKQIDKDSVREDAQQLIGKLNEPDADTVHQLFVQFLGERPGSQLPDTRGDFQIPDSLRGVMDACCDLTFAVPTISRGFRWTERVAPVMRDAKRWDHEGVSKQDESQAMVSEFREQREQRGRAFVITAPMHAIDGLRDIAKTEGSMAALQSLNQYHDGNAWLSIHDPTVPRGMPTMGLDAGMKLLAALFREKPDG